MKYTEKKFTLPVGSPKVDQKNWDRSFLSDEEFKTKYVDTAKEKE